MCIEAGVQFLFAKPLSKLVSVVLPETVTMIGRSALREVGIPDGVEYIGPQVFTYCDRVSFSVAEGSPAQEYAREDNIPYIVRSERVRF